MAGIVFLRTSELERIVRFYTEEIGMELWLEQPGIRILRHENLLVGFQDGVSSDTDSLITFFYATREEVDRMYLQLGDRATTELCENDRFRIYNFYATDPDGRRIEFQCFLHELPPWR